jgi:uncharacterized protein
LFINISIQDGENNQMPNKLINETSPYLLQHANNPVDWYPWSKEALQKAVTENKPIFLSIGYAACHWCHVMEHESFENPQVARILNENFVSIKVDREERPDLDSIYMNAVVAMTGQGGWPMSVFLTPQGEPFYGGTYFPPSRRHGLPAFGEVLEAIIKSWENESAEITRVGRDLAQHLRESNTWQTQPGMVMRPDVLQQAAQALLNTYDWTMGGWGHAPRFPQPMAIEFLLMQSARGTEKALDAASHALMQMSRGGLYDVVGGGFHRYSTDDDWLVPHFEKMLYDNGQLALAYLHGYLLTKNIAFRQVCTETLDFILREMTHPDGGFYSSLDADSEGGEGSYYVWSTEEISQALPDANDQTLLQQVYSITQRGNFEGKNILKRGTDLNQVAVSMEMDEEALIARLDSIHKKMYAFREQRVRPPTDDKVLVSWNSNALRAFAEAARYLNRPDYLAAAQKNAAFILREMYAQGRLMRAWRNGQARHNAFLEDHAGLILALLALYQTDHDSRWYQAAENLAGDMNNHFRDPQGGFFDTRHDHDELLTRPKDIQDNATPSGNALAASALLYMAAYSERSDWHAQAEGMLVTMQDLMVRHPTAFSFWLQGLDFAAGPVRQVAVIGPQQLPITQQLLAHIWRTYRPRTVVASAPAEDSSDAPGLLHDRPMVQGRPTVYVCEGFTCNLPVNDLDGLKQQME